MMREPIFHGDMADLGGNSTRTNRFAEHHRNGRDSNQRGTQLIAVASEHLKANYIDAMLLLLRPTSGFAVQSLRKKVRVQ
jgi:hypothetical protein